VVVMTMMTAPPVLTKSVTNQTQICTESAVMTALSHCQQIRPLKEAVPLQEALTTPASQPQQHLMSRPQQLLTHPHRQAAAFHPLALLQDSTLQARPHQQAAAPHPLALLGDWRLLAASGETPSDPSHRLPKPQQPQCSQRLQTLSEFWRDYMRTKREVKFPIAVSHTFNAGMDKCIAKVECGQDEFGNLEIVEEALSTLMEDLKTS